MAVATSVRRPFSISLIVALLTALRDSGVLDGSGCSSGFLHGRRRQECVDARDRQAPVNAPATIRFGAVTCTSLPVSRSLGLTTGPGPRKGVKSLTRRTLLSIEATTRRWCFARRSNRTAAPERCVGCFLLWNHRVSPSGGIFSIISVDHRRWGQREQRGAWVF